MSPLILLLSVAVSILFLPFNTEALNISNFSLYDKIPQLQALNNVSAPSTAVGSRFNTSYCCLQAIRDGIAHGPDTSVNGKFNGGFLLTNDDSEYYSVNGSKIRFGDNNITSFIKTTQQDGGFPCDTVDSFANGKAPSVTITARYCLDTCGRGWERSLTSNPNDWLSPFFGFIIPAVVFCLTIPRRRKLEIPNTLFHARLDDLFAWIFAIPKLIIAAILVGSDTLVWLCICFAFAGPMLLSATLEAFIDNRLVYFFETKESIHLTAQMKSLLLFVVLCGNLDLDKKDENAQHQNTNMNPTLPMITAPEHEPRASDEHFPENGQSSSGVRHSGTTLALDILPPRLSVAGLQDDFHGWRGSIQENDRARLLDEESNVGLQPEHAVDEHNNEHHEYAETLIPQDPVHEIIHDVRRTLENLRNNPGDQATEYMGDADSKLQQIEDLVKGLRSQAAVNAAIQETDQPGPLRAETNSPLDHIEQLIYDLRLYEPQGHCDIEESEEQISQVCPCYHSSQWKPENSERSKASTFDRYKHCLARVQTRLRTMLACQYSFGSTVGSPIVFFVGAFIFTLVTELVDLGDKGTALNLSFGQWWMIIPQAGNNPNTLEGVVAHETLPEDNAITFSTIVSDVFIHSGLITRKWFESKRADGKPKRFVAFLKHPILNWIGIQLAYPSRYKTQWLWQRGVNKRHWIAAVTDNYLISEAKIPEEYRVGEEDLRVEDMSLSEDEKQRMDPAVLALCKKMNLSSGDWARIFSMSSFLLLVPFSLSFMTSYVTPSIGVSCRSLTFTIYLFTQIMQMAVAFYNYRASFRKPSIFWCRIRFVTAVILGIISVFTAIGGTMMQLGGVFSNCICDTSLQYWLDRDNPKATLEIATNTSLEVHQAHKFWVPGAGTAVAFLGTVCYVGWWYQRRLRNKFRLVVEGLHKARVA